MLQRLNRRSLLIAGLLVLGVACTPQQAAKPLPAPTVVAATAVSADTARRTDIQQSLSYTGDIRAREQISVVPKSSGRVQQVLVDTGSQVKAGDSLAVLEQDSAQISVLQVGAALAGAQAKLASMQAGPRAEDIAAAEAALAQQQARFSNMRSGGRSEDILAAEAGVAAAIARMQALENGADDGVRQAQQSAVNSDAAALASAEAAYAALGGQNAASLQAAQAQVDSLQAQMTTAQSLITSADAALGSLGGTTTADVQAAQSAVDQSRSQLQTAQAALKQAYQPTQAAIAQAQAALEQARSQRSAAEANQTALEQNVGGACADVVVNGVKISHNSTTCGDAKAAATAAVTAANAGTEAAQGQLDLLTRGGPPALQTQLQATVDQAQAQVSAAAARLDALKSGGIAATRAQAEAQKQQAQGQLVQAQENLKTAEANLAAARGGNLDAQVKNANAQVTAARERLKADQARLDVIIGGPTDEDVRQAQAGIDQAQQQLNKARLPYTGFDLQQQEQAVAQATAVLRKVESPYTDQDLTAAQAAVDQAQAAVDLAELGLKEMTVVAPVDGIVAERLVSPGALISPQTPIVTLVPPSLELVVNVEESQLARLAAGQVAQLEVPAFPAETFGGKVTSIAPIMDGKSRTTAVRIEPTDSTGRLRGGMFASVTIITAEKPNALVVPRAAIMPGRPGIEPLVMAIDSGGSIHRQPVKLGLQNDQLVEILSGIDDGQLVATSSLSNLSDGEIVAPQVDTQTAYAR